MAKLTLKDLPLKDKRVLMRIDFNVPLNKEGGVEDDMRIRESLPSIEYVIKEGGKLILMSHLGRPDGKRMEKFSLAPCALALSKLLKKPVRFVTECIGKEAENATGEMKSGDVILLENLRFHPAEEDPAADPTFAQRLSRLGDLYVNDAFGTAHRAHSSTFTLAKLFLGKAAMGFLMQKELSFLQPLLENPKHPFYAVIGGAKISSKIGVLKSLVPKVDALFIGGGMAFTFLKAQGISIGNSIVEEGHLSTAKDLLKLCAAKSLPLFLPKDLLIADKIDKNAKVKIVSVQEGVPSGWQGVDLGPQTLKEWTSALQKGETIFWNGPVGIFEIPLFAKGTQGLAHSLAKLKSTRIVGGGDSVAAINQLNLAKNFTHLSTGGGAALELIEYGKLPGIDALSDK